MLLESGVADPGAWTRITLPRPSLAVLEISATGPQRVFHQGHVLDARRPVGTTVTRMPRALVFLLMGLDSTAAEWLEKRVAGYQLGHP